MKNAIVDNPTSEITLTHPFKDILPDVDEFFKSDNEIGTINTINALCYKIASLSEKYSVQIDANKFKGDALELFTEYLIKTNASDNRIGIYKYEPINVTQDVGVDGRGIGENSYPATVQVKFRAGDYVLTANEDHLSNFLVSSWNDFAVRTEDDKNMLIITTGMKVDEQSREKMLKSKVRVLNREALKEMLDNRPEWWLRFYEATKASRLVKQFIPVTALRKHQMEAIQACTTDSNHKGKIILPTGSGKTLIEAEIIYDTIVRVQKDEELPVIKVNSSRILLCFQLFEEIFSYLNSKGITARYINYNSGNADDRYYIAELRKLGGAYREIISTTSSEAVIEAYQKASKENLPLIVFSTYHSSEKFAEAKIIPHLTIHDEAHNLVSNEFYKAANLPSNANFFFTATEKITDGENGLGMNNPYIFDNMIYTKSPKEMIDEGEMVPPYIHIIKAKNGQTVDLDKLERDYEALVKSISDAFMAHQKKIRETSYSPTELGAKVLVVCRGQQDLMEMFKTQVFTTFRTENPDIHLFALSSDFGLYNDGEMQQAPVTNAKKYMFLKKVKSLGANEKAIIFHVDMIGEGIDVPGITGVIPFRNCELSKFVQNIGRASRLHKKDRERLYAGEISPADRSKWIKPYSWVIIPNFLENSDGFYARFRDIVYKLRNEFGYIPKQHTVIDNVKGFSPEEEIDKVNEKTRSHSRAKSGLEEFSHEFEDVSVVEKVIYESEVGEERLKIQAELGDLISSSQKLVQNNVEIKEDKQEAKEEVAEADSSVNVDSIIFSLDYGEINAKLMIQDEKFVILRGSEIRSKINPSVNKGYIEKREGLIKNGFIKDWLVVKDIVCKSPSLAAAIVVGNNMNGKTSWKYKDKVLADFIK